MQPSISVCIPARNEEKYIGQCLDSIHAAAAELNAPVEIIVILNRCTDQTEAIARSHNAVILREDAKNLSVIRNAGVKAASAPIVITIDADSRMSPNMLVEVERRLNSGKTIGGGVAIRPERWSLGILVSGIVLAILILPLRVSAGLFWMKKEDFLAIEGFNEKMITGEDIDFARRLRLRGAHTHRPFRTIVRASITSSCRKFDQFGDWYYVNPWRLWKFYKGIDRAVADEHWYEVKR